MKKVTVSFTAAEYRELAKLVTLGMFVTSSQDDYEYSDLVEELEVKICKQGFKHMPESGLFMKSNPHNLLNLPVPEFGISDELFDECEALERVHVRREGQEEFVDWMSVRDCNEKYGKMEAEEVVNNPEYMRFVLGRQTEYRQELLLNGVTNLRLVK